MSKFRIKNHKNLPNLNSTTPNKQQELELLEQLEKAHDEFILQAARDGYDVENDPSVGQREMQQFSAMKQLAKNLGLPIDKYNEKIKALRVKILGPEVAGKYFPEE